MGIIKIDANSVEKTREQKQIWTKEHLKERIATLKEAEKEFQDMLNLLE